MSRGAKIISSLPKLNVVSLKASKVLSWSYGIVFQL